MDIWLGEVGERLSPKPPREVSSATYTSSHFSPFFDIKFLHLRFLYFPVGVFSQGDGMGEEEPCYILSYFSTCNL